MKPTNFKASYKEHYDGIRLTWEANLRKSQYLEIQRAYKKPQGFKPIKSPIDVKETKYTDRPEPLIGDYFYRICTVDKNGKASLWSDTVRGAVKEVPKVADASTPLGYQIRWYSGGIKYEGLLWEKDNDVWELSVKYYVGGLHIVQETLTAGTYQGIPCLVGSDVHSTCTMSPNAQYSVHHFIIDEGNGKIYTFDENSNRPVEVKIIDTVLNYARLSYLVRIKYSCN